MLDGACCEFAARWYSDRAMHVAAPTQQQTVWPQNGSGAIATIAVDLDAGIVQTLLSTGRLNFILMPGGVRHVSRENLAAALGTLLTDLGSAGASG